MTVQIFVKHFLLNFNLVGGEYGYVNVKVIHFKIGCISFEENFMYQFEYI